MKSIQSKFSFLLGIIMCLAILSGCQTRKKQGKTYQDFENKKTQFDQKKYKFHDGHPPVQRYYSKSKLFRPKK